MHKSRTVTKSTQKFYLLFCYCKSAFLSRICFTLKIGDFFCIQRFLTIERFSHVFQWFIRILWEYWFSLFKFNWILRLRFSFISFFIFIFQNECKEWNKITFFYIAPFFSYETFLSPFSNSLSFFNSLSSECTKHCLLRLF